MLNLHMLVYMYTSICVCKYIDLFIMEKWHMHNIYTIFFMTSTACQYFFNYDAESF